MLRALSAVLFASAIAGLGLGCNAILGNDEHTLEVCPPDTRKCSDTGADVLVCADGKGFTKEKSCDFACADGACTGICVPGDTQCKGDELEKCDDVGQWQKEKVCPSVCENGACTTCNVNDTRCMGTTVQVCDDQGTWKSSTTCPYVCDAGACTGMCVPDDSQCNGDTPETCDDTGTWQQGTPCPKVCSAGMCVGMCTPGSSQCSNQIPETCNSNGQWDDGTPCPFVCQGGTCTGVCTPNDVQCMGSVPQICDAAGQWQSGAACPFLCTGGACTGVCTPTDVQGCGSAANCNAGGMQTCDANGAWGPCMPQPSPCVTTPGNWSPVAVTNGACPAGFGFPQAYIATVSAAPYTCTCNCSGTQICQGTGVLNHYTSGTCSGSPASTANLNFSTNCGPGGPAISAGNGYILSNVSFGPAPACSAMPFATNKPSPNETNITLCQPALACPGGACLSAAEQGNMCVSHAGMMACPSAFPNQTIVSSGITDSRGCGMCGCGSTLGCTFQSLLIDNDSACGTANPYNFTEAANTCVAAPNGYPFNASKANATVTGSGTCAQTAPSNPNGGVTLDASGLITVCCP